MTTAEPTALAPLRVPAYRRLWAAALVSNLGTFLQLVAAPWLMLELTGSPFMVSLVTAAMMLPRLVITLPAGALADGLDRRTLLLVGQTAAATAVAALAVLSWRGLVTPASLVALTAALGFATAVAMPAYQTLVHDLVPRPLVPAAVTLNSAAFNVARAVGPAIGGALVAAGLVATAFGLNAVSYLALVVAIFTLPRDIAAPGRRQPVWRSSVAGIRYARFTPAVRSVLVVSAAFSLTSASVQALLPSVAADDLGLGASGFGALLGAFGAGALTGAGTRERARQRLGARQLPVSITLSGLGALALGLAPVPLAAGVALAVAGLAWVWTLTTLNATVQLLAPRWVRGRLMSLYLMAVMGVQPLGALIAGAIAEEVGAGTTVAVLAAFTITTGLVAARAALPTLTDISEPTVPDDWTTPPHAEHVAGSPVLVTTTWQVAPEDVDAFADVLRQLRRQRYRTGAHRWSVYRDAADPLRITEVFEVHDWSEHLRQHERIDEHVAAVIRRALAFDRAGGPVTRHLAGIDLSDPDGTPIEEQLLTVHAELHGRDGSVPLDHR